MEALSLVAEHDGPQRPGVLSAERRGSPVKDHTLLETCMTAAFEIREIGDAGLRRNDRHVRMPIPEVARRYSSPRRRQ